MAKRFIRILDKQDMCMLPSSERSTERQRDRRTLRKRLMFLGIQPARIQLAIHRWRQRQPARRRRHLQTQTAIREPGAFIHFTMPPADRLILASEAQCDV